MMNTTRNITLLVSGVLLVPMAVQASQMDDAEPIEPTIHTLVHLLASRADWLTNETEALPEQIRDLVEEILDYARGSLCITGGHTYFADVGDYARYAETAIHGAQQPRSKEFPALIRGVDNFGGIHVATLTVKQSSDGMGCGSEENDGPAIGFTINEHGQVEPIKPDPQAWSRWASPEP